MGRDKAKDDKYVNFSQPCELQPIADKYKDLTVDKLKDLEEDIKSYFGKGSNQHVTHDQVYEYLEDIENLKKS